MAIKAAGIIEESIVDGPGIRFVLFTQGCLLHCEGCHNQHTWDINGGTLMTSEELLSKIKSNPLIKGVTISGGEPFLQSKELIEFATGVKELGKELAIYSGYTFEQIIADEEKLELLKLADILVDGPFILAQKSLELKFRGSKNQRIINVKESLKTGEAVIETSKRWGGEN